MKDIIVAVADGYQEKVIEALLARVPVSSRTASFTFDIIINPGHDAGAYNDSHELLRAYINQYRYAIVVLDFEGTGVEHKTVAGVEEDIQALLSKNGWEGRCKTVVIHPELETWMWSDNPHVENAIGWERKESLYEWARKEGHLPDGALKPQRPKETLEKAMRLSLTPKSASIYRKIAAHVSYRACRDEALLSLITQLKTWFALNDNT